MDASFTAKFLTQGTVMEAYGPSHLLEMGASMSVTLPGHWKWMRLATHSDSDVLATAL